MFCDLGNHRRLVSTTPHWRNNDFDIPPMWCCTDQAAMIAKVAEHLYDMKIFAPLSIGVDPNWFIEDYKNFE